MGNVEIEASLVDGGLMPYIDESHSCKAAVQFVTRDDQRPPVRNLFINIKTESGKTVSVVIPNDTTHAIVNIDGEKV